jgi:hypothetical protein
MKTRKTSTRPSLERWWHSIWLPLCSFTYIAICIFDFMVMPVYTAFHNTHVEDRIIAELKSNPTGQDSFITDYEKNTTIKQWNPLTLLGGGLFHLSFGMLLTGGAITRGFAKKSEVEGYYNTMAAQASNGGPDPDKDTPPQKLPKL